MFLLMIVFLFSFAMVVIASDGSHSDQKSLAVKDKHKDWTNKQLTKRLKDLGLTEKQIDSLNYETRVEIAKTKNAKRVLFFANEQHSFAKNGSGDFSTMSLESDLYLNIVGIDVGTNNGHPYVKLVADYNWNNMPFYRLHDGFAITFSDGWYATHWGFTDYQKKCSSSYRGMCAYYDWYSDYHGNAHDETRLGGIGWLYDLTSAAVDAKGTAYVYIQANDESRIRSTTYTGIKSWYGHDRYRSNIFISVNPAVYAGIAASVSFGGEQYTEDSSSIYNPSLSW